VSELPRGLVGAVAVAALGLGAVTLATLAPLAGTAGLALGVGLAWAGPRLAARLDDAAWRRLGLGAVIAFSAAGLAWALAVDSMQPSDFGVYWRCGTTPVASVSEQLALCQSRYMAPTPLYWLRSLLSTAPFGALAGARPRLFDVYNALLHAASLALLWVMARRALGAAAAFVAVLAWGLFPERVFAITLATPDNVAALFVLAALWLASDDEGRVTPRLVLLGVALAAVELCRSAGPIFSLAVLAAAVAGPAAHRRSRLFVALGGAALGATLTRALVALLPGEWSQRGVVETLAALDLTSLQTFDVALRWYDHVLPAVPAAERGAFALDTLRLELGGHGLAYPAYLVAKAKVHFTGAGYAGWAALDLSGNPDTALTVAKPTVPTLPPGLLSAALGLSLGLALVGAARLRHASLLTTALAAAATFFASVLLFNEAQPRYLFVVGPALALLASASFIVEPASRDFALPRGLAVLLAVALAFTAWSRWASRRPRPLEAAVALEAPGCGGLPVLGPSLQRLRVELPPGVTCAVVRVPLGRYARRLRAVVTQARFPFPFEARADAGLDWRLDFGAQRREGRLGTQSADFVRLDGAGSELVLHVSRAASSEAAALELAHLSVD